MCVGFTPVCIDISISVIFSVTEVNTWSVRSEIFGRIFGVHHCIVSNQWQRWRRKRRIHGNTEIYNKQNVSLKLVLNWFTSTYRFGSMVFNATFNNISAISWRLSKGSCVLWPMQNIDLSNCNEYFPVYGNFSPCHLSDLTTSYPVDISYIVTTFTLRVNMTPPNGNNFWYTGIVCSYTTRLATYLPLMSYK